jgi:hypothetical protein
MQKFSLIAVVALVGLLAVSVQAAPIVTNGGFETGDFTGWITDLVTSGFTNVSSSAPRTGTYAADFGALSSGTADAISQTLPTFPGFYYQVVFYLAQDGTTQDAGFQALWNGTDVIADVVGSDSSGYAVYSANLLGNGGDTLSFSGWNGANYYHLDDVSVTQGNAVIPEPATFLLLGGALLGLGLIRRRR